MKIFKLRTTDFGFKKIERKIFEEETQKSAPWYQEDGKKQFALCPACLNPIQIIGLYNDKDYESNPPYGKHTDKGVAKVGNFDLNKLVYCPLRSKNKRAWQKSDLKDRVDDECRAILTCMVEKFDRVVYLLRKTSGISFSKKLCEKFLTEYKIKEGYRYAGAHLLNIPWMLAYIPMSKSLYKQFIVDEDIKRAILNLEPNAVISDEG